MGVAQNVTAESFLPSPDLTVKVTGEVGGKKETKEVFTLNHPDILGLMRYVWAGAMLPTTADDYTRRMSIDKDTVKDVKDEIDIMVKTYTDIQKDNVKFRDVTWVNMVTLTGKICNFAKLAGGKEIDGSYFAQLLLSITDYNVAKMDNKEKEMKICRSDIISFTTKLIASTTELKDASKKTKDEIATFKNATSNHALELKTNEETITNMLVKAGGDIKTLNAKIKELQETLEQQQKDYDHAVVVAATTPTYAWVTIFGLIAAVSVASVYGVKATQMKNAMEATQSEIDKDKEKVKTATIVSTDSQRMSIGVKALIKLIDPAITTLAKIETVWQTISDDLQGLCDQAKNDPDNIPSVRMGKTEIKNMMDSWNSLYDYADNFRKTAYISQPEIITLKEWVEKYGKEEEKE